MTKHLNHLATLAVIGIAILSSSCDSSTTARAASDSPPIKQQKWENKLVIYERDGEADADLPAQGKEGWELVSINLSYTPGNHAVYVAGFKRQQ